jgi:4-carboxymuconolactone decarboxylase
MNQAGEENRVDYREVLRRLAIGDTSLVEGGPSKSVSAPATCNLDPKTRSFVRLGASVALGANAPGFQSDVDNALSAGASLEEVVGVLIAVAPTVGAARLVLAAPALALAVGYDTDAALEAPDPQ